MPETTMDEATWAAQVEATEAELVEVRQHLERTRTTYSEALVSPDFDAEEEAELEGQKHELERRARVLEERLEHLRSPEIREAVRRPRARERVEELAAEVREAGQGVEELVAEARALQEDYLELLERIARAPALQKHRREELAALGTLYDLETPDVRGAMVELDRETKEALLGGFEKRIGEAFRQGEAAGGGRQTHGLHQAVYDLEHATSRAARRKALVSIAGRVSDGSRDLVEAVVDALEASAV